MRLTVCQFITADSITIVIVKTNYRPNLSEHGFGNRQLELFRFGLAVVSN